MGIPGVEELLASLAMEADTGLISHDGPLFPPDKHFPAITHQVARVIDKTMSCEEAVSLAFLVIEKCPIAFSLASTIETSHQNAFHLPTSPTNQKPLSIGIVEMLVISAEKNKAVTWEMKVYQALVLLGHKRLLYNLGVDEAHIKNLAGKQYVKANRRMLFDLAEHLSGKEAVHLASLLEGNKWKLLEVQLLALMASKHSEDLCIPIHGAIQKMDSANLLSHFLSLSGCPCSLHTARLHSASQGVLSGEEYYTQGAGLCVIVNQKTFSSCLQDRLGTDRDRDELAATFTLFEGEVMTTDNLSARDMTDYLQRAAVRANNLNYHWVAVCVLTHGRRVDNVDEVLGCDGQGVDRKEIIKMFANAEKCPNLLKKPKLFVFQACRGPEGPRTPDSTPSSPGDRDTVTSDSAAVSTVKGYPVMSDYIVASSTIEDFVAFRSTVDGSFYIRHLCKVLQEKGHLEHLSDILINVTSKVMSYRPDYPSVPENINVLSKKFQLRRTRESTRKCIQMMAKNQLFNVLMDEFISKQTVSPIP